MFMMAMKDLFCLVNAFMNRTKNEGGGGSDSEREISVPLEAAEDTRVLPGSSHSSTNKNGFLLANLEPFQHLLPDLGGVDLNQQKKLHNALYSAGVSAALSLQKFIYEAPTRAKSSDGSSSPPGQSMTLDIEPDDAEWKEIFNHLSKFIALDESVDSIPALSAANMEEFVRKTEGSKSLMKIISNEVAAAALAAFASATYRRPPTKQVESLMQTSQETGPTSVEEDGDDAASEPQLRPQDLKRFAAIKTGNVIDPAAAAAKALLQNHSSPAVFKESSRSNSSSIVALAGEDIDDDDHDECYCESDVDELDEEDSLFRYVCAAGHDDLAKLLVSVRNSAEFRIRSDSTPLMEACCGGHTELVRVLVEAGADVNAASSTRNTALIYACASGHIDCVRELLKSGKCDLSLRNDAGHCALMEAANIGDLEIVKLLIVQGAVPSSIVDNVDYKHLRKVKESSLTLAAYKGHTDVVEYLISAMPKTADRDEEFHTALMEAAMDGHVGVAKLLLNAGAQVNLPSESFESPLTLASCGGHLELVALLIEAGADLEEPNDEGYTPLMEASREGHREVVELLLDHGANVNAKIDEGIETSLTLAASGGFKSVVELLVARGGDLTIGERTPLYEAVQEGHTDVAQFIVQHLGKTYPIQEFQSDLNNALVCAAEINNATLCVMLLENGAQIDCFSKENKTPLMEAARQNNMPVVELLVHRGADVNKIAPGNECTALSLAASNGHSGVLRYLLEHGGNPHQVLKDSFTCLLEASKNGHTQCVELLLSYDLQKGHDTSAVQKKPSSTQKTSAANATAKQDLKRSIFAQQQQKSPGKTLPQQQQQAYDNSSKRKRLGGESNDLSGPNNQKDDLATAVSSNSSSSAAAQHPQQFDVVNSQLFSALAAAAASSPCGPDDWLFAQFIQRSLITTKKRETMSEEELRNFTEMIQQQFRAIFPSGQVDAAALVSSAGQQALSNIYAAAALAESKRSGEPASPLSNSSAMLPETLSGEAAKAVEALAGVLSDESLSPPTVPCCERTAAKIGDKVAASTAKKQRSHSVKAEASSVTKRTFAVSAAVKVQQQPPLPHPVNHKPPPCPHLSCARTSPCPPPGTKQKLHQQPHNHGHHHTCGKMSSAASAKSTATATGGTANANNPNANNPQMNATDPSHVQSETNHDTALTLACVGGHVSVVKLLLDQGADFEHRDKKGFTPLILASTGGHAEVCKLLLDVGCQVDAQADRTKDTALSLACSGGRKDVVELLLKYGSNKEHRNLSDYTPLSLAASGGYVDIIQLLLTNGAEINSRTGSKLGISPLMLAAMNGHENASKMLLDNGSDINAQIETNRNTALTLACFQGRAEVANLLIDYGANVEHRAKTGLTPLMEAANGGYADVGELLLDAGADVNAAPVPTSRDTALTIAADKGHHRFVELLVHSEAQINVRNKKGCSALWLACNGGHLETVQILVKHNADTDAQDNRKLSPLMIAFRKGHIKVVKYLCRHVIQFPSDQECVRFVSTLTDPELISKCRQCIEFIQTAKAKQAEEANKAAESLLEMLAQEEAMEQSRKLTKQRQKEKKKAKKQQEKKAIPDDDEDEEGSSIKEEHESKTTTATTLTTATTGSKYGADSRGCSPMPPAGSEKIDETEAKSSLSLSTLPKDAPLEKFGYGQEVDDFDTIVQVHQQQISQDEFDMVSENHQSAPRVPLNIEMKAAIARVNGRGGGGSNGNAIREATNSHSEVEKINTNTRRKQTARKTAAKSSPEEKTGNVGGSNNTMTVAQPMKGSNGSSSEEAEWLRASKKRASMNKGVSAVPSKSSSSGGAGPIIQHQSSQDESDAQGNRRSTQVLNIESKAIARVIGRGGSNVNAIREATNAHIEVEKINPRREQTTRKITIKGTAESIKYSVRMIELLLRDNDTHISDIVAIVLARKASPTPGRSTTPPPNEIRAAKKSAAAAKKPSPTPLMSIPIADPNAVSPPPPPTIIASASVTAIVATTAAPTINGISASKSANAPPPAANVWQQRAAIREKQKTQLTKPVQVTSVAAPPPPQLQTTVTPSVAPVDQPVVSAANTPSPKVATTAVTVTHPKTPPLPIGSQKQPSVVVDVEPSPSAAINRDVSATSILKGLSSLVLDRFSPIGQPITAATISNAQSQNAAATVTLPKTLPLPIGSQKQPTVVAPSPPTVVNREVPTASVLKGFSSTRVISASVADTSTDDTTVPTYPSPWHHLLATMGRPMVSAAEQLPLSSSKGQQNVAAVSNDHQRSIDPLAELGISISAAMQMPSSNDFRMKHHQQLQQQQSSMFNTAASEFKPQQHAPLQQSQQRPQGQYGVVGQPPPPVGQRAPPIQPSRLPPSQQQNNGQNTANPVPSTFPNMLFYPNAVNVPAPAQAPPNSTNFQHQHHHAVSHQQQQPQPSMVPRMPPPPSMLPLQNDHHHHQVDVPVQHVQQHHHAQTAGNHLQQQHQAAQQQPQQFVHPPPGFYHHHPAAPHPGVPSPVIFQQQHHHQAAPPPTAAYANRALPPTAAVQGGSGPEQQQSQQCFQMPFSMPPQHQQQYAPLPSQPQLGDSRYYRY